MDDRQRGFPFLRVILIVAVVAMVVIGILTMVRRGVFYWAASKYLEHPVVAIVPKPLEMTEPDPRIGETVRGDGYRFEAPWTGLEVEGGPETMWVHRLPDGRKVGLMGPGMALALRDEFMRAGGARTEAEIRRVLGPETLADNLSFLRAVMEASEDDANALRDGRDGERGAILLGLKAALAINGETGIFSFAAPELQGYQLGDPSQARRVSIQAVDVDDRPVEIWFMASEDGTGFTQAEINRVISTFERAGSEPPELPEK